MKAIFIYTKSEIYLWQSNRVRIYFRGDTHLSVGRQAMIHLILLIMCSSDIAVALTEGKDKGSGTRIETIENWIVLRRVVES